jgi:peptide/nickel transport system substrate-binding protein
MQMKPATIPLLAALLAGAIPATAQTLNVAVGGAFTSMDPHYHNLGPNNVLTSYVFSSLLRPDPKYTPEPDLAVSWQTISPTEWEFKLRDGVTFSDGTPFTADDVVFSFARIPKVLNSPSSFNYAVKPITRIEVVDAHLLCGFTPRSRSRCCRITSPGCVSSLARSARVRQRPTTTR